MSGIMTFYWASLKNDSRVVARSYQVGDEWGGGWMVEEGEVDYGSTDLFRFRLFSGDATLEDFKIADEGENSMPLIEFLEKFVQRLKEKQESR